MKVHFYCSVLFFLISYLLPAQSLEFATLTCNSQINPIAIDSEQPLFSWIVDAEGFNREQSAYQILVASSPEWLNENEALVTAELPGIEQFLMA